MPINQAGIIMLGGLFFSAGTRKLIRVYQKIDGAKNTAKQEENILNAVKDLRTGQKFVFSQDGNHKLHLKL